MVFAFVILSINIWKSCDTCACSVSTGGIGLLPQMHYNFVGARWQYTIFRSVKEYNEGNETIDQFDQFEIWRMLGFDFYIGKVTLGVTFQ